MKTIKVKLTQVTSSERANIFRSSSALQTFRFKIFRALKVKAFSPRKHTIRFTGDVKILVFFIDNS